MIAHFSVLGEIGTRFTSTFYGSSFIAGSIGEKVIEADRSSETVLTATFDLDEVALLHSG
jgi:N-carbamoylputrescine amidase